MDIDKVNPVELGHRIAAARRARNRSQEEAAQRLGVSRPTYIAIEKGTRALKAAEVIALADFLGRSVHDLVSDRKPVTDFAPQFRVTQSAQVAPEAVHQAVEEFRQVCNDYLWLEELQAAPMPRYRPIEEYSFTGNAQTVAEDIASLERSRLNLGQGPLLNLLDVLEAEAGLRVFVLPLREFRIAGMFAYTDRLGGCILINGAHPPTRQAWSAVHEYAHFLTARYQSEVTVLMDYERKPRTEQFADFFAAAFLMPAAGLRQRFNSTIQSRQDFTVADLCLLAGQYGVSLEAMTRRMERLGCVKPGTWKRLSDANLSALRGQAGASLSTGSKERLRLPERYRRLAVQAFEEEKITEGQLARLLRCSRIESREAVETLTQSSEVDVTTGTAYRLELNVGTNLELAERDYA